MRIQEVFPLRGIVERAIVEVEKRLASGEVDVTLDFKEVTFVSVDGLEWLEELLLRSNSRQAKVTFINVSPTVYKVFKIAHIKSLLEACGGLPR